MVRLSSWRKLTYRSFGKNVIETVLKWCVFVFVRLLHSAFLWWCGSDCEAHQGQTLPGSKKYSSPIGPRLIGATALFDSQSFLSAKQKSKSEKSAVGSEGWEEGESEEEQDEEEVDGGERDEEGEKKEEEEEEEEKEETEEEEERKRKAEASPSHPPVKKKTDEGKWDNLTSAQLLWRYRCLLWSREVT